MEYQEPLTMKYIEYVTVAMLDTDFRGWLFPGVSI